MQETQKKLAGPNPQEAPAQNKPFAGRSALISGLMGTARAYEENPPAITSRQEIESRQILQSRQIYETVLDMVTTRNNIANFREALIIQAQSIAIRRKAAEATAAPKVVHEVPAGRPSTKRDALAMALADLGLDASITAERVSGEKAMFTVECMGTSNRVPVNDSVMESEDPVAKVKLILSFLALGKVDEEERRAQRLEQRRSTRPPPTPIGIDSKELDCRMVTFDGELEHGTKGKWIFTYLAKGMETSFSFESEVTGEDLLDMIDERIDMLHKQYDQPYPAAVLEWRSRGRAQKGYMGGVSGEILDIACTLDYLATCPMGMRALVPPEYMEGFDALKKLPPPHAAFLGEEEAKSLTHALDELEHPLISIVRQTYGDTTRLDGRAREEVLSLLSLSQTVAVDFCEAAVRNIADAYTLIGSDNLAVFSSPDELRRGYLRMSYTVRKEVEKAVSEGAIEVGL
jgi:hypothetical protein